MPWQSKNNCQKWIDDNADWDKCFVSFDHIWKNWNTLFHFKINETIREHFIIMLTIMATYADDIAILRVRIDPEEASSLLWTHLNLIDNWSIKYRIKINSNKSVYVPSTPENIQPSIFLISRNSNTDFFGTQIS